MKKLRFAVVAMCSLWVLCVVYTARRPVPSESKPNPRYGAPAISTATVAAAEDFTVLMSDESMEGLYRGTGVLINATTVLTCAHMLNDAHSIDSMWIYPYPGAQVVHAKVVRVDKSNDLALLRLTTPVVGHRIPVIAKDTAKGEPIVVVGNINGFMQWFVSYGIVSGEHDRWLLTDATIRGGNSGGPWVNARGEVVAITDVGWEDGSGRAVGISGGVPAKAIRKFLEGQQGKASKRHRSEAS